MSVGDFPLNNKIVAVTGGGSGINLAFAKLAVQQGARVLIADLRLTADGEAFVNSAKSDSVAFTRCDVTKRADLENIISESQNKFGEVPDVYIAGAGVFAPDWSNWWDDTEEDAYAEININTIHPIKLTRIAMKALLAANKKGVVVIVSSLAGYVGSFAAPTYSASKHAITGFVRSVVDLDRLAGIKVTAVSPGMVQTPLWTDRPDKMKQFGYDPETAVLPEDVANAMIDVATNGKYGGGTCLEVSIGGTRPLGVWNVEPPQALGTNVPQEFIDMNYAPLIKKMEQERGKQVNGTTNSKQADSLPSLA